VSGRKTINQQHTASMNVPLALLRTEPCSPTQPACPHPVLPCLPTPVPPLAPPLA
jgi:hypothetical protein